MKVVYDIRRKILDLSRSGMSQTDIAHYLHCSQSHVSTIVRMYANKKPILDGGKIRALRRAKWSEAKIASEFRMDTGNMSIDAETIRNILDRMGVA